MNKIKRNISIKFYITIATSYYYTKFYVTLLKKIFNARRYIGSTVVIKIITHNSARYYYTYL